MNIVKCKIDHRLGAAACDRKPALSRPGPSCWPDATCPRFRRDRSTSRGIDRKL